MKYVQYTKFESILEWINRREQPNKRCKCTERTENSGVDAICTKQKPPWEYLDSEWHSVTVHMYIVHTYVQFNIEYQRNDPKYDKEVIKAMSVEC